MSESDGDGEREVNESTEKNGFKRKREEKEDEKVIEKEKKIDDEMESIEAPTITTSWRRAIGSSEWLKQQYLHEKVQEKLTPAKLWKKV